MSVEPVFDCEFWYTNEYYPSPLPTATPRVGFPTATPLQTPGWQTRITAFRFPSCTHCVGDCDRNYQVTQAELYTCIDISLGNQPLANCYRGDGNGDGFITVDEITLATNYKLHGCPTDGQAPPQANWQAAPLGVTITQEVASASGRRGGKIMLPVSLAGGGGTISGTQLDIVYPSNVLSNPSCVIDARLTAHSLRTGVPAEPATLPGQARLRTLLVDPNTASTLADGTLFSCTFTIKTTAPSGTFTIRGDQQRVSDGAGNAPPSATTSGSVTVF